MDKSRSYIMIIVMAAAAVAIAAFVLGSGGSGGTQVANITSFDGKPVPQSLLASMAVPDSVAASIGKGAATTQVMANATGPAYESGGKPAILYIGADYCPYCAITRWGLIVALLRFGNFTGLTYMTSSPDDVAPSATTFSFYNSTYSSQYVSFVPVELAGNKPVNGTLPVLQTPTATENAILAKYDPRGGIPFMDFANVTVEAGANYQDPTILVGSNWTYIAGRLDNTSTVESMAIVGSANIYTAAICNADGNQPSSVCGQSYIRGIESQIK